MSTVSVILLVLSGVIGGGIIGFVSGFAMASHSDVLRGVRPATSNRLVLFLARPSSEIQSFQAVLVLLLGILWLGLFALLCALPAVVAAGLSVHDSLFVVGYLPGIVSLWLLRRFGAHAWRVIA